MKSEESCADGIVFLSVKILIYTMVLNVFSLHQAVAHELVYEVGEVDFKFRYKSNSNLEELFYIGSVKIRGREVASLGKIRPLLTDDVFVFQPIFYNVDDDSLKEILVLKRSRISENSALKHTGRFYDLIVFDDLNSLKNNDLLLPRLEFEQIFSPLGLDGGFSMRRSKSILIDANGEPNWGRIKLILDKYSFQEEYY